MDSRDNYISTAKAIGIILMVIGHSIGPNCFCRFIYFFHMPLFFFCSGFFYKVPESWYLCGQFVIRRIKGLYFPFVKWSIIFLLLHNLFFYLLFYPIDNDYYGIYDIGDYIGHLRSILITMTGQDKMLDPFWFLKELLFASIIVCLLTFFLKKFSFRYKKLLLWLVLIALAVITKPGELGVPVIWNLSILFLSASFFMAGHIYHKIENKDSYNWAGFFISMAIVFSVTLIWNDSLDMLWYNAYSVLLYIPTALVGIFMVLSASNLLERYRIKYYFYYIGNNTLIILSLHLLVFKIVNYIIISVYDLPIECLADTYIKQKNQLLWIIYVVVGIVLPLLFQKFYGVVVGSKLCKSN